MFGKEWKLSSLRLVSKHIFVCVCVWRGAFYKQELHLVFLYTDIIFIISASFCIQGKRLIINMHGIGNDSRVQINFPYFKFIFLSVTYFHVCGWFAYMHACVSHAGIVPGRVSCRYPIPWDWR